MSRLEQIKQIHQSIIRKKAVSNFYNAAASLNQVSTIGVDNAPHIDWQKENSDIENDIREQIFG
jgi:dihydroorotase